MQGRRIRRQTPPVYEDSCVEFFIAFDDAGYYNLEFNCMGTLLVGYGPGKQNRQLLDAALAAEIRSKARICKNKPGIVEWDLTLMIPLLPFGSTGLPSFKERNAAATF